MITIKLKIKNEIDVEEIQREFSSLVRFSYNRLLEKKTQSETINLAKSLNNITLDSSWKEFAFKKAEFLYKSQLTRELSTLIFGGKKNFQKLSEKKITKEQYKKNRLLPILSIGKSGDTSGNRKFLLDLKNNKVIFKPDRSNHIDIILSKLSKNQKLLLEQIEVKAKNHESPITYELTNSHICIIFDESYCSEQYNNFKRDRILSIDSNPNYLGISICDYNSSGKQRIIHKEIISNKQINDMNTKGVSSSNPLSIYKTNKTNKRNHEICEVAKYISKLAQSKHCEYVAIEKLSIESKDHLKGRNYNRLVNNQWNRNKLFNGIKKWCNIKSIKLKEVPPQYSSFIGCINYPTEIDSIAASLEINRRTNAYVSTYITKTNKQTNYIIYPKLSKKLILNKWKDDGLTDKDLGSWIDLYKWFKNKPELSYRLLFTPEMAEKSLRLFSYKSKLEKVYGIVKE
jgi:predicted transposase